MYSLQKVEQGIVKLKKLFEIFNVNTESVPVSYNTFASINIGQLFVFCNNTNIMFVKTSSYTVMRFANKLKDDKWYICELGDTVRITDIKQNVIDNISMY